MHIDREYLEMTAEIVSAYVGNNNLSPADLPGLVRDVHGALTGTKGGSAKSVNGDLVPAVPIKRSVTADYLICLEDGKKFKSLKRHINTHYGLSPAAYREKWGLPHDYPMVAPNYAKARSQLAREMGLGRARPPARGRKRSR